MIYCLLFGWKVSRARKSNSIGSLFVLDVDIVDRSFHGFSVGVWHVCSLKIMISLLFCFLLRRSMENNISGKSTEAICPLCMWAYMHVCVCVMCFHTIFGRFVGHRKKTFIIDFALFHLNPAIGTAYGQGHTGLVAMIFKWEQGNDLSLLLSTKKKKQEIRCVPFFHSLQNDFGAISVQLFPLNDLHLVWESFLISTVSRTIDWVPHSNQNLQLNLTVRFAKVTSF